MAYEYSTIVTEYDKGVMFATISNPPANVMTAALYNDLVGFTTEVETDDSSNLRRVARHETLLIAVNMLI